MNLRDLIDAVVRTPAESSASFVVQGPPVAGPGAFVPEESYVEIRLAQMHLRDRRRLWREFMPLGTVVSELQFAGRRHTVPFVVGPQLLADAPNRDAGELVEFYGTRVAGPFPYLGDDLVIFTALAALETENWARRALSVLGTVASSFDVTKLSSYVDVAGALTGALQGLLGMREVEQRLGVQRTFTTPPGSGALEPGYQAFIAAPMTDYPPSRRAGFSVRDGRLHEGDQPFAAADFMVLQVACSDTRPDYSSFPFHRVHWREAERHALEGREQEAWNRLQLLASDLAASDDLVPAHREALLDEYAERLERTIERRRRIFERGDVRGLEDERPPEALDERGLREAIERRRGTARTPEQLLARVRR